MNEKNEKPESGQKTGTKKSGLAREGIAYLIFGVLTTVIDYAISNLLYYMWKMDPVPGPDDRLGGSRIVRICDEQMVGV